jgi:hypothetical protein
VNLDLLNRRLDLKLNISKTYPLKNLRFDQVFENRQDVVEVPNAVEEEYSFRSQAEDVLLMLF